MESGQRKDASGKLIPAWFISTVTIKAQGKEVFAADFGSAISKDPLIQRYVKLRKLADCQPGKHFDSLNCL
jgi:hypothetical protein